MVANESNLEQMARQDEGDHHHLHDFVDDEEAEETLSLCNLAMNSTAEDYYTTDFYKEGQNESFEFYNEDFSASLTYPKDKIIFCGKVLFPYDNGGTISNRTLTPKSFPKQQKLKKSDAFPWKSNLFNKQESQQQEKKTASKLATTVKSRWYLFAFGMGRFDAEMGPRNIRRRQSRRISTSMLQSDGGEENKPSREKGSVGKQGWRRLLRAWVNQARKR